MDKTQIIMEAQQVDAIRPDSIEGVTLIRQIGSGASSDVYLARDLASGEEVAVKVLSSYYSQLEESQARWTREVEVLIRLQHPNIVRGIRAGAVGKRSWFMMEYIRGETLADRLKREGSLEDAAVLDIARGALAALQALHQEGGIHRDIKPSNIIIDGKGTLKLMDFGLARTTNDRAVTLVGSILGTPVYISPEQARGDPTLDIRTDLYSLGITLFHLACGEPPFSFFNTSLLLTRKITDDVPDLRHFKPDARPELAYLVAQLSQRNRDRRPATPADGLALMDQLLSGEFTTVDIAPARKDAPPHRTVSRSGIPVNHPVLKTVVADAALQSRTLFLERDEVLFYEDDKSREAYILLSGSLEVMRAGAQIARLDEPGSFVGEMSALLEAPRTATIRALDQSVLLQIKEEDFKEFIHRHPGMGFQLARTLAQRVDATNRKLSDAQGRLEIVRKQFRMIEKQLGDA